MAAPGNSTENLPEIEVIHDGTPPDVNPKGTTDPKVLVESIFASPEALNLLRSAFTSKSVGASDSVGAPKAPVTDQSHITQAGALKAQETTRTKVNTVSADVEDGDNPPLAKQPRLSEHVELEEDLEEDIYSSASRWQASEELSAFIETFRKPLQPFERKAICRKFPRPDVDAAYTPLLDEYLSSLVPGIKQADKDGKFLHDRFLDALGPMAFLYEHLNEILSASKEQGTVLLSSDQLQGLFNASAHGLRLLGNASALLAKERRSTVLKKSIPRGL